MGIDLVGRLEWLGYILIAWIVVFFVLWLFFRKKMPPLGLAIISLFLGLVLIAIWALATSNKDSGVKNDVIKSIEINQPDLPESIQPQNLEQNQPLNLGD
jgi:RsiW-degrading membrane proteinase PrsW (M82 family)